MFTVDISVVMLWLRASSSVALVVCSACNAASIDDLFVFTVDTSVSIR